MSADASPFTDLEGLAHGRMGTHFSHFYQSREDLEEAVAPFIAAGLRANQRCLWVTAAPLGSEAALESLDRIMPGTDDFIDRGQLEIIGHGQWYRQAGAFNAQAVIEGWIEQESQALDSGYAGLRITGNTFWLDKPDDFASFADYEARLHRQLMGRNIVCLCSYHLDKCSASTLLDVVHNHDFAVVRRGGEWEVLESASAHAALTEELERKERLLAEIHHRVKNNLQVVSSLLTLGSAKFGGPEAMEALDDTLARIHAMALVHELLYQRGDGSAIAFGTYLRELSAFLIQAHRVEGRISISVTEDGEKFPPLPVDAAIPLGIASAEAVTNALKHAFPDGANGTVALRLERQGADLVLRIEDDGRGFERKRSTGGRVGAGLTLIEGLARQVGGTVHVDGGSGARVTFRIPAAVAHEQTSRRFRHG